MHSGHLYDEHRLHDVVWRKFAKQFEGLKVWLAQIAALGFSECPHEDRLPNDSLRHIRVINAHDSGTNSWANVT